MINTETPEDEEYRSSRRESTNQDLAVIEAAAAGTSVPDLLTAPEPECFAPWISRFFLPPHSFLEFHSCMFLLSVESTPIQGDATLAWLEYKN